MSISKLKILSNASKSFQNGKELFSNYDFSVSEKLTFIMGPNGCGKTTLLRLILGLDELSSGNILYNVTETDRKSSVLQDYNSQLLLNCSIQQNIDIVFGSSNENIQRITERVLELLYSWGYLLSKKDKLINLSGGQKQAFVVARSLINSPKLLLLDEPVSAIDFKRRVQILKSIKNSSQFDYGIVITHDINDAIMIADRLIVYGANLQVIIDIKIPKVINTVSIEDQLLSSWADKLRRQVVSSTYVSNYE